MSDWYLVRWCRRWLEIRRHRQCNQLCGRCHKHPCSRTNLSWFRNRLLLRFGSFDCRNRRSPCIRTSMDLAWLHRPARGRKAGHVRKESNGVRRRRPEATSDLNSAVGLVWVSSQVKIRSMPVSWLADIGRQPEPDWWRNTQEAEPVDTKEEKSWIKARIGYAEKEHWNGDVVVPWFDQNYLPHVHKSGQWNRKWTINPSLKKNFKLWHKIVF